MKLNFTKKENQHIVLNDDQKSIWIDFTDAEGRKEGFELQADVLYALLWEHYKKVRNSFNEVDDMFKTIISGKSDSQK
jgi:pectate lyase